MSKDKSIHEKFVDFLNQYDLLEKFKKNLYKSKALSLEDFTNKYKTHPEEYTNYCFGWSSTPEGSDFWQSINMRWGRFLCKLPPSMVINLDEGKTNYKLETFEVQYSRNEAGDEEDYEEEEYDEEDYDEEDYDEEDY